MPNNKYRKDSTKYATDLMMKYVISLLNDDKINGSKSSWLGSPILHQLLCSQPRKREYIILKSFVQKIYFHMRQSK